MNKKLIISLVVVLVIIAATVGAYVYFRPAVPADIENADENQLQTEFEGMGQIFICTDECGNGVCQQTETQCAEGLNCVCNETPEVCPADCGS